MNHYVQQAVAFRNQLRQTSGALIGIAQGILADGKLHDAEIVFLRDWLARHSAVASVWPGNAIAAQIAEAMAEGPISTGRRQHLLNILQQLVGGTFDQLAEPGHVSELALDKVETVEFVGRSFCLTGEFCFGTRNSCHEAIVARGGEVTRAVTKKLHYLVIGGMGSDEWKHGSFGIKVEKAMSYKQAGLPIRVVHEDPWAHSLMASR